MKKVLLGSLVLALSVALVSSAAFAKKTDSGYGTYDRTANWQDLQGMDNPNSPNAPVEFRKGGIFASAAANTVVLTTLGGTAPYTFNSGNNCVAQGWVTQDITQQTGTYWHVDDFALSNALGDIPNGATSAGGLSYTAIAGTKSMWMGKRIPPAGPVDPIHCGYLGLPGYGNGWNQAFCSKACLAVGGGPTTDLDVSFTIKYDSEPSYDATSLEYTTDCAGNVGWTEIDGGNPAWTNFFQGAVGGSYAVGAGPVKVRVRFLADTAWSNQDGLYAGFGVAIDDLVAETLPLENFELAAVGATSVTHWEACNTPGYGNYLALFKKADANYEDQCLDNLGCYWAAIQGSTEFYNCGTPPQGAQRVVPYVNVRNEYITNEVWSPQIPLAGTGTDFRLRYTVYRDLPLDNLIFHVWHVRTIDNTGCPSAWADRNFVYYGDNKDWLITENLIGSKVAATASTTHIQVAIGIIDMCPFWCGVFGTGACHSPAPYIDQVKVLRVDNVGPQWDVRDLETFQDTFADNGTIVGTAKFNSANDIKPSASPTFTPGDSAIVQFLVDPAFISGTGTNANGLMADPNVSTFIGRHKTKKRVYMHVKVVPTQVAKSGAALSEGPGGQANRYPYAGTDANGWDMIRMDYTYTGTATNPGWGDILPGPPVTADPFVQNRFNVDLNDALFTPGDTILYFYSATGGGGSTTYFSTSWGTTASISEVAANPMETTILPAGGFNRGGDILYVDGFDGGGVQNYFDGAHMVLGLEDLIDRYDVRGPTSGVSNRLAGRVQNVQNQLNNCYQKIIWDSGPSSITLGDGSGDPEKTDDYGLMNTFLTNLTNPGGVMILGDRGAEYLDSYGSGSAVAFKSTYMPFTLINDNHRLAPTLLPISPKVMAWPGRAYSDNFNLDGGCAALNDFDVLGAPVATSTRIEMSYTTAMGGNGAVVSHVNGNATVILTGFSLAYVRDDEQDGISDRAKFLRDSYFYMGNPLGQVTGAGDSPKKNSLDQNYPNPFNPQTTIAFSVKDRGAVTLKVYNVSGELVRTLANEDRAAGSYTVTWDGHNDAGQPVSSGVYFYKLVTNNFSQTKKMVLLK